MGACFSKAESDLNIKHISSGIANDITPGSPTSAMDISKQVSKMSNKEIEKYLKVLEKQQRTVIKTLLLGSGSSGKSTLFRQIECIHGEEKFSDTIDGMERFFVDSDSITKHIRLNAINALIKLLKKSQILCKPPYNINKCIIDDTDEKTANALKILVHFKANKMSEFGHDTFNGHDIKALGTAMELLWKLEAIQETYKNRHYFSLYENTDYFLDKITVIMDESDSNRYIPSFDDVLNARMRTMGIIERTYRINKTTFNMFDVGGQRNERRKWMSLFDNVNVVIFVAALNHYCSVLFEDETVNAMQESIKLFDETANSKWFSSGKTQWIVFLNKNDLFINRLYSDRISIKECFEGYAGKNYADKNENEFETEMQKHEWFNLCYAECIEFIKNKYLERIKNVEVRQHVCVHVTVATKKSNIETVFADVTAGIISRNLASFGIT